MGSCIGRWKVGFAALLLLEGLVFGHIVYVLKRATSAGPKFQAALRIGTCVSAGVFFATGMLHVLPEAIELFSGEHEEHHEEEERLLLRAVRQTEPEEEEEHAEFPWVFFIVMVSFYALFFFERVLLPKLSRKKAVMDDQPTELATGSETEMGNKMMHMTEIPGSNAVPLQAAGFRSPAFAKGLVEILGLSAHSLFESLALGLSDDFSTVLNIFIATAAHRWATSTALAFKLSRDLRYMPFLVLLCIFSTMVPIGIGVGAALNSLGEKVRGVLFAISAGTFFYVGVFDGVSEEFAEGQTWIGRKFASMLAGAVVIVVVTAILVATEVGH